MRYHYEAKTLNRYGTLKNSLNGSRGAGSGSGPPVGPPGGGGCGGPPVPIGPPPRGGGGGGGGGGGPPDEEAAPPIPQHIIHPGKDINKMYGITPSDIDKYSRIMFPVCFVCFNLMYWILYLHISDVVADDLVLLEED